MTLGAMVGWLAVYQGASLWSGVGFAALAGAALGLLLGLLTVPLGLSQHVTGHRRHPARDQHRLFHLPRAAAQRRHAAADRALPDAGRRPARRPAAGRPGAGAADRAHAPGPRPGAAPGLAALPHAARPRPARGRRQPGRRRGARARRLRAAPGCRRRGQRPDGDRRRVPHPLGLQRLLLRHGQRPRLDLHSARHLRLLAPRQGAPGCPPVRRLRRLPGPPAAARWAGPCPTSSS